MTSKCNDGKCMCKYLGDLPDDCHKFYKGEYNGDPIRDWSKFPMLCRECKDRDGYWCKNRSDLICFAEQDPFNCKKDLTNDTLSGADLLEFRIKALERAQKKWGSPLTNKGKT
jgi:hypothetical protein